MAGTQEIIDFPNLYHNGQHLQLMEDGQVVTEAIATTFDPTTSNYWGGGSKAISPPPDHWHVLLREVDSDNWIPAAVYYTRRYDVPYLAPHIKLEHVLAERWNEEGPTDKRPLVYGTDELADRVRAVAARVTEIVPCS